MKPDASGRGTGISGARQNCFQLQNAKQKPRDLSSAHPTYRRLSRARFPRVRFRARYAPVVTDRKVNPLRNHGVKRKEMITA